MHRFPDNRFDSVDILDIIKTIEKEIDLPKGSYEMRMNVTESSFNLNWVEFEIFNEKPDEGEDEIIERVSIYPNPAKDNFYVISPRQLNSIEVFDISGKR